MTKRQAKQKKGVENKTPFAVSSSDLQKARQKLVAELGLEKYVLDLDLNGYAVVPPEVTGVTPAQVIDSLKCFWPSRKSSSVALLRSQRVRRRNSISAIIAARSNFSQRRNRVNFN